MQRRIIMCCDTCCEPTIAKVVGASVHARVCWREVVSKYPLSKEVQLEPSPNKGLVFTYHGRWRLLYTEDTRVPFTKIEESEKAMAVSNHP